MNDIYSRSACGMRVGYCGCQYCYAAEELVHHEIDFREETGSDLQEFQCAPHSLSLGAFIEVEGLEVAVSLWNKAQAEGVDMECLKAWQYSRDKVEEVLSGCYCPD